MKFIAHRKIDIHEQIVAHNFFFENWFSIQIFWEILK